MLIQTTFSVMFVQKWCNSQKVLLLKYIFEPVLRYSTKSSLQACKVTCHAAWSRVKATSDTRSGINGNYY